MNSGLVSIVNETVYLFYSMVSFTKHKFQLFILLSKCLSSLREKIITNITARGETMNFHTGGGWVDLALFIVIHKATHHPILPSTLSLWHKLHIARIRVACLICFFLYQCRRRSRACGRVVIEFSKQYVTRAGHIRNTHLFANKQQPYTDFFPLQVIYCGLQL